MRRCPDQDKIKEMRDSTMMIIVKHMKRNKTMTDPTRDPPRVFLPNILKKTMKLFKEVCNSVSFISVTEVLVTQWLVHVSFMSVAEVLVTQWLGHDQVLKSFCSYWCDVSFK